MTNEMIFGFSKTDKIGFFLLGLGGVGFLFNYSQTLGHFLIGDFSHLIQPSLFPSYIAVPILVIMAMGTFLTMRWLMTTESSVRELGFDRK